MLSTPRNIYAWLTQPIHDPTNSGRVSMDYLTKLVTTALEWTDVAGETDVKAETLKKAAELLVLRRDTLQIIDRAGSDALVSLPDRAKEEECEESRKHHPGNSDCTASRWDDHKDYRH